MRSRFSSHSDPLFRSPSTDSGAGFRTGSRAGSSRGTAGAPDDKKFVRRRKELIQQLREKGIQSEDVLRAMSVIPRQKFIDSALEARAYEDSALPIGFGQTISQPYTVAAQTELLLLKPGEKVLEIGTGSGYQCAVLCEMGAMVYSVERHDGLYQEAKKCLTTLGYRPHLKCGDGTKGWSAYAPYDAILVTAGAPVIPDELIRQLAVGGRLVIPVGDQALQVMKRVTRISEEEIHEESFRHFKFVPLIGEQGW